MPNPFSVAFEGHFAHAISRPFRANRHIRCFPGLKAWAKFFSPSGGCYEIACALPREEVKYWKISEFSIPGKGELLWGQVAQRSVGSRVAQKGLSAQQNDSVGEQSHDPSEVEAIEKESP